MNIILNQTLEIENLISQSGNFTQSQLHEAIINMVNKYREYIIRDNDCVITTTKFVEIINGEQVIDVEVLLPVNCSLTVKSPYIFKKSLKIVNAIYSKVDNIINLQETLNYINEYISKNELQPITTAYLLQGKDKDSQFVEVYIGLNPNIL